MDEFEKVEKELRINALVTKKYVEVFEKLPESAKANVIAGGFYLLMCNLAKECSPMTKEEKQSLQNAVSELDDYVQELQS